MPDNAPEPDANGWLRVTDKDTGHKSSIRPEQLPHGNYMVLKADASDPNTGEALPPEFNAVKPAAPSGQSAESKES